MRPRNGAFYTVVFSGLIASICAVLVSTAAVTLRDRQTVNAELERRRNVLRAAGVMGLEESLPGAEVERRFAAFAPVVVDLRTGRADPAFDLAGYDQRRATGDPARSRQAPANAAQIARIPDHAVVYERRDGNGRLELLVLPVEGKGLWSTMYGYLALAADLSTVRGLAFYEHGETPGLGGEIDNPRWTARWPGRATFDEDGRVAIEVARGPVGPPADDPHRVDGLSGATLTSRGVTGTLRFWLGEDGFGPYLEELRKEAVGGSLP